MWTKKKINKIKKSFIRDKKSLMKRDVGGTSMNNNKWWKSWWLMRHLPQQIMTAITLSQSLWKKKCSGRHLFGKWLNWRICDVFLLASITIGFQYWVVVATWCIILLAQVTVLCSFFWWKMGLTTSFFGIWTLFPCFIWYKGLYKDYVLFERLCGPFVWGLQTIFVRVSWVTLKVEKKWATLCVRACFYVCPDLLETEQSSGNRGPSSLLQSPTPGFHYTQSHCHTLSQAVTVAVSLSLNPSCPVECSWSYQIP